jgi:hypothetical protein
MQIHKVVLVHRVYTEHVFQQEPNIFVIVFQAT